MAEYLHNEGLASQGHGDIQFRTPREWSQIGKFERQKAMVTYTQEAINMAKVRHRAPARLHRNVRVDVVGVNWQLSVDSRHEEGPESRGYRTP